MRIAEINMTISGSTGKIMLDIASVARDKGHDVKTFSTNVFSKRYKRLPKAPKGHEYYGWYLDHGVHYILSTRFGKNGTHSCLSTLNLIRKLKKFNPDVVHIHNLHKYCINLSLLFKYFKTNGVKVFWTLHDCWSFTGHCPNFDACDCEKWKTECRDCPQLSEYPKEKKDTSLQMYELKKKWFTGVKDLTLICPSEWLKDKVKQSFLKDYPIEVIKNGIDLSVFKPTDNNFRIKYGLENKKIVLAVADAWTERKGIDVVIMLANRLDVNYAVVIVGIDESVKKLLPENVIAIRRTENQIELAEIYSSADVFVNPTREEALGLVNIESLACGTPVITFDTGGSPETIDDTCGIVVPKDDISAMEESVKLVCIDKLFSRDDCVKRAKRFNKNQKFAEYVRLYERE